ncbi:Oxidative stress-induced growth inhibitor 2, partial [Nibea albiflora]
EGRLAAVQRVQERVGPRLETGGRLQVSEVWWWSRMSAVGRRTWEKMRLSSSIPDVTKTSRFSRGGERRASANGSYSYTPYLSPEASHPNPLLHSKLAEQPHLSLLEQDLEYLCEGLEGRSSNPVAVLFDSLLLPDSDFGLDHTSPLAWRYEPERAIPHLVLGKGPPGGAWHAMEGSMLTLSLANWMELPGLKLKDWMREKRRNVRNDRATPAEIASYYEHYVSQMSLEHNFACGTTVTSVTRQPGSQEGAPACWRVMGLQRREGGELGGTWMKTHTCLDQHVV